MAKIALCDTCFWIALFDDADGHSGDSETIYNMLVEANYDIVAPWPALYEFLNSKFFRRLDWIKKFETVERKGHLKKLSDGPYRQYAYDNMFTESRTYRDQSLADFVMKGMIKDPDVKVSAFVTFDQGFELVCQVNGIEMLP